MHAHNGGDHRNERDLESLLTSPQVITRIARRLCGKENAHLSTKTDLRFGTHGSLSVDLGKGAFYDHECSVGGGLLDLINHKIGGGHAEAFDWLRREGFLGNNSSERRNGAHTEHGGASQQKNGKRQMVATYDYLDEVGVLLFQVVRFEPKDFRQRRPDPKGGWIWNIEGVRIVPYRLPELCEAISSGKTVFVVEGEKDADNLAKLGIAATCNSGGVGKWYSEHAAFLRGAGVVILPDNDEAGRKHAQTNVAGSLQGIAARVQVIDLPDLPPKGDVSNWIDAGGTADELWHLVEKAPPWPPEQNANGYAETNESSFTSGADMSTGIKAWPIMESKATHGIVGKIARLATANSEADPVAVITTTLTWAAAELGRSQFIRIGDDVHHSRHFGAVVGASSRARKGTSLAPVRRIFTEAERIRRSRSTLPFPSGSKLKVSNGPLSSGEGLVYAIRDKSEDDEDDVGIADKRILCAEGELGAAFRAFQRSGNTLSMILRRAFDGETIAPLIKNNRTVATDPHINVIGHITRHELKQLLPATEIWNGLGNRFMWVCARRPKVVAFPTPMPDDKVTEIATELARVIELAHTRKDNELVMSNSAMDHWAKVYPELTKDQTGVLGAVTSRAEAHARRLALTYAQLDGADRIEIEHLEAGLAFIRFAGDCAAYLFGVAELDPVAQKILEALTTGPKTQTEISHLFGRHLPRDKLGNVLTDLQERGRITLTIEKTDGAPRRVWSLAS